MSPKSESSSPHSSSLQERDLLPGTLVHYDDEGQLILAVVIGTKKDKISILTIRSRELDLIRSRLYVLPGKLTGDLSSTATRVARLQEISQQIEGQASAFDVAELWSFVHEEARAFTVSELTRLYLGSDDLVNHAALRMALVRERIHFKRDRECFEPRAQHVVEELCRAEEAKAHKHALRERALQFVAARAQDSSIVIPVDLRDAFRLLEEVAASIVHTDPARQKEARDFVHLCGEQLGLSDSMPIEKRAFEVLLKVGIFNEHSNLALIRHDIPTEYSTEVELEVQSLNVPDTVTTFPERERAFRRDLTAQIAFTIDDISTLDMDDALSLERTPDGYELGIHITDVTAAVTPGSRIDRAAKRRATSLYCADRTINMLPLRLAEDLCSLKSGVVRPCLSVLVSLSESLEVLSTEVCGSFIRVARRYTYEEVDELLEAGDSNMLVLHDIAAALEEQRIKDGAMRVQKREVVPFFEDGKVRLLEIEEDSPARLLVSEMMVLANTVMADFAAARGIAVLFRGQERPDGQTDDAAKDAQVPEGPAKDFSARTKLKKSSVSFKPIRHAGLGVNAYIQATSPIRRYMDLCHQRQILSFLRDGSAIISHEDFERIAAEVETPLQAAGLASRETKRYWLLRYLEQRERNKPIAGTVVRLDLKAPLVELDEVYITVMVRFSHKVTLGQRVTLRVTAIDPHSDYVRLTS